MTKDTVNNKLSNQVVREFRGQLLNWYDRHARALPWRYRAEEKPDPYYVWLSEIMCQQTTVQAVIPYFQKFTEKWPDVFALACAEREEIMNAWAGLGYYARARNLHACAQTIVRDWDGKFPRTREELQQLPGIGEYTSAAIAAIAYNEDCTVVDGNIERVISRVFALETPLPEAKPEIRKLAARFFEGFSERPGDLAQAFMDLGALICIPKSPRCAICPVRQYCIAGQSNNAENYPKKAEKKTRPIRFGYLYWIEDKETDHILLETRKEQGMLGGMTGFPTSEWIPHENLKHPEGLLIHKESRAPFIKHIFTHFELRLFLIKAGLQDKNFLNARMFWHPRQAMDEIGFPTVFKKAYKIWTKTGL